MPAAHCDHVGIIAYAGREAALTSARELAEFLAQRGVRTVYHPDLAEALDEPEAGVPEEDLGRGRLLVALGGDGTLLAANRLASPHGTPIRPGAGPSHRCSRN